MIKKKPTMWTLDEAHALVSEIQERVRACHYHVMLGGGVLWRGWSVKDLDLFFSPLNGYTSRPHEIRQLLDQLGWGQAHAIRDSPDYQAGDPWHWRDLIWFTVNGRRIDVFIQ